MRYSEKKYSIFTSQQKRSAVKKLIQRCQTTKDCPESRLLMAVIFKAVDDLDDTDDNRISAQDFFFDGPAFALYADLLGIDVTYVRELISELLPSAGVKRRASTAV